MVVKVKELSVSERIQM